MKRYGIFTITINGNYITGVNIAFKYDKKVIKILNQHNIRITLTDTKIYVNELAVDDRYLERLKKARYNIAVLKVQQKYKQK